MGTFPEARNVNFLFNVKFQSTDSTSAIRYFGQYGHGVKTSNSAKETISMIPADTEKSANLIPLIASFRLFNL